MKTNQEIFDIVAAHLLTQMAKSQRLNYVGECDEYLACMYRGGNDMKCAAGVLIPDSLYRPALEGRIVTDYGVTAALEGVSLLSLPLLLRLQEIHDLAEVKTWELCLRSAAAEHDLVFNAQAYGLKADNSALYDLPAELPEPSASPVQG